MHTHTPSAPQTKLESLNIHARKQHRINYIIEMIKQGPEYLNNCLRLKHQSSEVLNSLQRDTFCVALHPQYLIKLVKMSKDGKMYNLEA